MWGQMEGGEGAHLPSERYVNEKQVNQDSSFNPSI